MVAEPKHRADAKDDAGPSIGLESTVQSPRHSRPKLPPGPKSPAIINMLRYALNPYHAMKEGLRYGPCYIVRMLGQPPIVSFTDPAAIKEIFLADIEVVRSGEAIADLL